MRRRLAHLTLTLLTTACSDSVIHSPDRSEKDPSSDVEESGSLVDPTRTEDRAPSHTPTGSENSDESSTEPGQAGSDVPISPVDAPGDPDTTDGETQGADPSAPTTPLADCEVPGPRLIRRLTARQYDNTLAALVGEERPKEVILSDPAVLGFHVDADAPLVSDLTAELLMNYAERVAAWTIENQVWRVASCSNHDESCHRQVIEEFGRRAFRQEPTPEQTRAYLQLFAAEQSFEAGLHVVLSTMLQSPYLLYRRELGEADGNRPGEYRLTPYEIASELSYFLTDGPPDDQLLNAAAEGRLSTQDEIDQQVHGLLGREPAKDALGSFVHAWLGVDGLFKKAKDPTVYDLTDSMRQAMLNETRAFFLDLFQSGGTLGDLYGADFTMINQPLAELYGFESVGGEGFTRVSLDGRRPTGVLGQAAFLTEHSLPENSSPVQRGVVVRERLLCQDLPPVPENLDTNLEEPGAFATNRERYEVHSSNPVCAGCHAAIDPIGFAFEEFDAFGRYRQNDSDAPIDASGELNDVAGGPVELDGLQSLNDYLSTSDEARSCLIRYWSYYAYGRDNWAQKECNHDAIRAEAAEGDYKLKSTLFAIIHAPHFTRRVAD